MNRDVLKVDLDLKDIRQVKKQLGIRLGYLHDIHLFNFNHISLIEAGKKKTWNAKIYLKNNIKEEQVLFLQLILGSDWRKEANTILNHYHLGMKYSNRMFDIKIYYNLQNIMKARKVDITEDVKKRVFDKNRKPYKN